MGTLLTTMSTLNYRNAVAYYAADVNGTRKYTTGISQQEIGTRFFLANKSAAINRIVVIGSDATFQSTDIMKISDIRTESEALRSHGQNNQSSAYMFYCWRINEYMNSLSKEEEEIGSGITEQRKADLSIIAATYLYELGFHKKEEWFLDIAESGNANMYFNHIRALIQNDISRNFVKPADYEKYENVDTFPELRAVIEEQNVIQSTEQNLLDIQKRLGSLVSNSGLKEAYIVNANDHLEKTREILERQRLTSKEQIYEEVLSRIKTTIQNLIAELTALKTNRVNAETAYVKYYIYSLLSSQYKMKPVEHKKPVEIVFVPLKRDGVENLNEIIHTIRESESNSIYIDMQGGSRTDAYVRNAVLSILSNEDSDSITIKEIVATDFNPRNFVNLLNDETSRYRITDLVSGMNAFIQYGRADMIQRYFSEIDFKNSRINSLVNQMINIDRTLSVCNINGFIASVRNIKALFAQKENVGNLEADVIFSILEEAIQRDYSILLSNHENDYSKLAEWALRKHFVQQALTIIESKMPEEFVRKGILYYAKSEEEKKQAENYLRNDFHIERQQLYRLSDVNHFFIKDYFGTSSSHSFLYFSNADFLNKIDRSSNKQIGSEALVKYLLENPDQERRGLHVYSNLPAEDAVHIYKLYMNLAKSRNELNHASININTLCDTLGEKDKKKYEADPGAAYKIFEDYMVSFLLEYKKILKKLPENQKSYYITANLEKILKDRTHQKKKNQNHPQTHRFTGTITLVKDTYLMIRSSDSKAPSPIAAMRDNVPSELFNSLKQGDKVTFEVGADKNKPNVKKAINIVKK